MTSESTYGREVVQIVELEQPRCGLRFGALPCTAAIAPDEIRTNIALWSQDFDDAVWIATNLRGTLTDGATAPDLTSTGTTWTENTDTGLRRLAQSVSLTSGVEYVLSVYAKQAAGSRHVSLSFGDAAFGTGGAAIFDLTSGASVVQFGTATAGADLVAGYWRCWIKQTATATSAVNFRIGMTNNTAAFAPSYLGDATSGIVIWGAQLEAGDAVSTYKKTEATAVSKRWGTGTSQCYNTYWTCQDRENYDPSGSIKWRFMKPQSGVHPLYAETGNDIATNPLFQLVSVSAAPSKINLGARRSGESPFGLRSQVTVTLADAEFDDHVGDYYLADRSSVAGAFWAKWAARNPFYPGGKIRVYEGYAGQAIGAMQVREYLLDKVDGPNASGQVTLRGADPLQLADKRRAIFPRPTDLRLKKDISASATTFILIGHQDDLNAVFGNTGARKYLRIGSEIIEYTGFTGTAPELTLTGVARGKLNTIAETHAADDGAQRVGRYERMRMYRVAYDLLTEHTPLGTASPYIDLVQWEEEGGAFLSTFSTTATIANPTDVEKLVGELCRDGLFSIWWDERQRLIPMLAVRPPQETPVQISDSLNILAGSAILTTAPDERMTRLTMYYKQDNPTKSLEDFTNYRQRRIRVEVEYEIPAATGGEIREHQIYSRWITSRSQAVLVAAQLLNRYKLIPEYLTVMLDAKDRAISIGDVLDVTTRVKINVDGQAIETRWQVIALEETQPGHAVRIDLQSYNYTGRYAYWMANDAPDFTGASDAQKARGAWWADAEGKLSDGEIGYRWQ